jgi:hypothetical protein
MLRRIALVIALAVLAAMAAAFWAGRQEAAPAAPTTTLAPTPAYQYVPIPAGPPSDPR